MGQDLVWQVQPGSAGIPHQAQRNWVLFRGDEPVVQIQTIWQRLDHFDVIMESGEGTYQVHMDLARRGAALGGLEDRRDGKRSRL